MMNDGGERQMHDATCANCGNATQVPFKPSGERPVYCRDCFQQMRGTKSGGPSGQREMHDATCATCGTATQVPFKPSGERPVYCRDCYAARR